MTHSEHTPGAWTVYSDPYALTVATFADGEVETLIATVERGSTPTPDYEEAAANAALAALNAAKGALGIRSPSKVFEQEIGRNMMAGIARGIARYTNLPDVALSQSLGGLSGRAGAGGNTNNVGGDTMTFNIYDQGAAQMALAWAEQRKTERLNATMGA